MLPYLTESVSRGRSSVDSVASLDQDMGITRNFQKYGVLFAALAGLLAGCGEHAPRATAYFAAHLDEARQLGAACRAGAIRGAECVNAAAALEAEDAKKRFRRFRGD